MDLWHALLDILILLAGAMVLGAVPLAIATGAGAEARHQIGWVIVGGMSFGTIFTLFVVPVVYLLLSGKHEVVKEDEHEPAPAAIPTAESPAVS